MFNNLLSMIAADVAVGSSLATMEPPAADSKGARALQVFWDKESGSAQRVLAAAAQRPRERDLVFNEHYAPLGDVRNHVYSNGSGPHANWPGSGPCGLQPGHRLLSIRDMLVDLGCVEDLRLDLAPDALAAAHQLSSEAATGQLPSASDRQLVLRPPRPPRSQAVLPRLKAALVKLSMFKPRTALAAGDELHSKHAPEALKEVQPVAGAVDEPTMPPADSTGKKRRRSDPYDVYTEFSPVFYVKTLQRAIAAREAATKCDCKYLAASAVTGLLGCKCVTPTLEERLLQPHALPSISALCAVYKTIRLGSKPFAWQTMQWIAPDAVPLCRDVDGALELLDSGPTATHEHAFCPCCQNQLSYAQARVQHEASDGSVTLMTICAICAAQRGEHQGKENITIDMSQVTKDRFRAVLRERRHATPIDGHHAYFQHADRPSRRYVSLPRLDYTEDVDFNKKHAAKRFPGNEMRQQRDAMCDRNKKAAHPQYNPLALSVYKGGLHIARHRLRPAKQIQHTSLLSSQSVDKCMITSPACKVAEQCKLSCTHHEPQVDYCAQTMTPAT